jgi:NADH-quinone oxidoreductase subunit C
MDHLETSLATLRARLGDGLIGQEDAHGETWLELRPEAVRQAARTLRDECSFDLLAGLTASDVWPAEPRFSLIYVVYSTTFNVFLRLRARVPGSAPQVDSLEPVYPAANWHERELYDMFGISFGGHSDLRRILMPFEWVGHPLRKDHPLGYEEVQFTFNFDEIDKRKPYAKE